MKVNYLISVRRRSRGGRLQRVHELASVLQQGRHEELGRQKRKDHVVRGIPGLNLF